MPKLSKTLTIIIPCKNEAIAANSVMQRFFVARERILAETFFQRVQLLVVDDNSIDGSYEILERYRCGESVKIIGSPKSLGYGGALKIGLQAAQGDWIAFYDMDFTYDPMDLIEMIHVLENNSAGTGVVCGDRLSKLEGMPFTRIFGNQFFVRVIQNVSGVRVKDSCTGMRLFHRDYIEAFLRLLPNDLNFTLAMTVLFLRFKVKIIEIPISYKKRMGQSKLKIFIDGPRFFFTILYYWLVYRWSESKRKTALRFLGIDS